MRITGTSLRRGAIWLFFGACSLLVAALLVPALTVVFERYKMVDSTANIIAAAGMAAFHLATTPWFAWSAGGGMGLVTGFLAGVWLDAIERRPDDRVAPPAPATEASAPVIQPTAILSRYESLQSAAREVYGRLGKCQLRDQIDAMSKNDDEILDLTARVMANYMPIRGVRRPSSLISRVDHSEFVHLAFCDGANSLRDVRGDGSRRVWTGLVVMKNDLLLCSRHLFAARHTQGAIGPPAAPPPTPAPPDKPEGT